MFAKRLVRPELLDHLSPEEALPNLADLVRINHRFGGHSAIRRTLERVAKPADSFTLLDVGAASGDTARMLQQIYPRALITSLDYKDTNLAAAPHPKLVADAWQLPFKAGSFDYVLCSLFLHHFSDDQVSQLMASFYQLARRALLICDLERSILSYLFLPATKLLLGWNKVTVHDGMVSVRASFRARELVTLARGAGISVAHVENHRCAFRLSLVAIK